MTTVNLDEASIVQVSKIANQLRKKGLCVSNNQVMAMLIKSALEKRKSKEFLKDMVGSDIEY